MTGLFYLAEAVLIAGLVAVLVPVGLWLYRSCEDTPLWLPVVALAAGVVLRAGCELSPVSWTYGWHDVIRRRIRERRP